MYQKNDETLTIINRMKEEDGCVAITLDDETFQAIKGNGLSRTSSSDIFCTNLLYPIQYICVIYRLGLSIYLNVSVALTTVSYLLIHDCHICAVCR